jgi:hypothetical protein
MKRFALLILLLALPVIAENRNQLDYESSQITAYGPAFASVHRLPRKTEAGVADTLQPPEEEVWERKVPDTAPPVKIPQHRDVMDQAIAARATTPILNLNFSGFPSEGNGQPDAIVAAGPAHVLTATNNRISIYTKTGVRRFVTDIYSWFAPLNNIFAGARVFDPQLIYDQYSKHYLFLCTSRRADKRSWILLSISRTSNPLGAWAYYAIDMQITRGVRNTLWADFPRLGLDEKAILITSNMYTFSTYIYRFPKIVVLKKSDLYAFRRLKFTQFSHFNDATGVPARNIHPAHSYGPAPIGYLVNTRNDAGSKITLWAVSYDRPSPVLHRITVNVSSYHVPPFALQKRGTNVINTATEGTGALSAIYRRGFIYTVHAIAHVWKTENVSALRYYQIDPSGNVIDEITYGSDGLSYYMPAVAVNNRGDVVIAFNRSGRTAYAGIFFCGRKNTDPPGTLSPAVPLHPGDSNYEVPFHGTNIDHWGDYNGISADAVNLTFWLFGEYAQSVNTWNTWIGHVRFP